MSAPDATGSVTALTFCWLLERSDGAGVGLTSHDSALFAKGVRYEPAVAIELSTIIKGHAGEPAGETGGALSSDAFAENDLLAGRWDGARSSVFAIDWSEPAAEPVLLAGGELGEISCKGDAFSAEMLGSARWLQEAVAPSTSPECRATLGDKKCRVGLKARRRRVEVLSVDGEQLTVDAEIGDEFRLGSARWIRGSNTGLQTIVRDVIGTQINLSEVPCLPILRGDVLLLTQGCDKRLQTCAVRFANVLNFRGEPHLPGNDLLTRYPGN